MWVDIVQNDEGIVSAEFERSADQPASGSLADASSCGGGARKTDVVGTVDNGIAHLLAGADNNRPECCRNTSIDESPA